ncbi:MAG: response regulator [Desulfobacteraceae bacterium]|nr:response regulator [Desulfobacteraceae bacterium]
METFITRFKNSLKASDLKSAKIILISIPNEPDQVKLDVLHELALAPDEIAWDLLLLLSQIDFGSSEIRERLMQLITDRAHLNFGFLPILYKTGGRKKIREAAPLMKHTLVKETDTGILTETIRAVGKNTIHALVDEISEYLYYDDQELKAQTVWALERIGSSKALFRLEEVAKTVKCDRNILDAIAILKQKEEEETKEKKEVVVRDARKEKKALLHSGNLKSTELDIRFNALVNLTEMGANNIEMLENDLGSDNHDLVINTLRIIARTIPEQMLGNLYALLSKEGLPNSVKFAVYEALGAYPGLESAASTLNGIDAPALHVRMAALNVLEKTPTDFVLAEIKNRIETGTRKGEILAETILDVKAKHIIEYLKISDTFSYIASNYLSKGAPLSSVKGYISILQERNLRSTAKKFNDIVEKASQEKRPGAMVISVSKTVQDVYGKLLFQAGYAPMGFYSPQDAFEKASEEKPGLIVSDLFLSEITALEFASEIREFYPPKEVTFVISTLQQDFGGNRLESVFSKIGIHGIVAFPARAGQIPSP